MFVAFAKYMVAAARCQTLGCYLQLPLIIVHFGLAPPVDGAELPRCLCTLTPVALKVEGLEFVYRLRAADAHTQAPTAPQHVPCGPFTSMLCSTICMLCIAKAEFGAEGFECAPKGPPRGQTLRALF